MEVNRSKLPPNLLDEVMLPDCPKKLKKVAENILNMVMRVQIQMDYHDMTQLDKIICLAYWDCYDGLHRVGQPPWLDFNTWFIKEATSGDLISRARRWLMSDKEDQTKNYLIIKQSVFDAAKNAGEHWRQDLG